ncbi:FtsX-like permease family protein [Streptococcus merionis]|uniref:Permease n=1 Tax=Streptococcus merionis TaxID=400065 RepID=A0A239ST53_9STRE|nr:FtsX-like permease family protein [Streptococcus merionis]SNU88587.1 permease [Streptococcus merionis]
MISLAWLQFKYSWKIWLFSLPVFIVCAFVINICLTNFFNFTNSSLVNADMAINTQLFFVPIIFGGIMIPIVLRNTVKEILNGLQKQNNVQIILGMTPEYLAILTGVELSIASLLGSICGSILSIPFAQIFYNFLVSTQGTQEFPVMSIKFSVQAFLMTSILIMFITIYSGYISSRRTFYKIQKNIENINIKNKDRYYLLKILLLLALNISIMIAFFSLLPEKLGVNSFGVLSVLLIFLEIMFISVLINTCGKLILFFFSKLFNILSNRFKFPLINFATYSINEHFDVFKKIYIPIAIISIFVSGFSSLLVDLPDGGDAGTRTSNMVVFLSAPLLIVLANTICMMWLLQEKETFEIQQLFVVGLRPLDIFLKKEFEILIYSFTTLILSLVCNFVLSLMFVRITQLFSTTMVWINIWLPSLLLSLVIFILMTIVAGTKVINTKWDILQFSIDTER